MCGYGRESGAPNALSKNGRLGDGGAMKVNERGGEGECRCLS